ncbi:MAG: hypothetical protein ACXV6K_09565 [Halobacteriota archaeon]
MKPLTVALCLTAIAALVISTCGCTESLNNSSENATQTAGPTLEANSLADAINKKYTDQGYEVVNPFVMNETAQRIVYSGAVREGNYIHYITLMLVRDYGVAQQEFNNQINHAQAAGDQQLAAGSDTYGSYWVGYYQGLYKDYSIPRLRLDLYYTTDYGLILPSASDGNPFYITNADVGHFYQITTNARVYNPVRP